KRLAGAGISHVEIERSANQMTVIISAAKPGIVIGKGGAQVEDLRKLMESTTGRKGRVTIQADRQPERAGDLVGRRVADQLVRRVAFRRAMKQAVQRATRFGAKGIRVQVAGRLGGSEMSRTEWEREGRVPLHTLRADIDFGQAEAHTTFGVIGVKVWIYRGDVLPTAKGAEAAAPPPPPPPARPARPRRGGDPRAAARPAGRAAASAAAAATPDAALAAPATEDAAVREAAPTEATLAPADAGSTPVEAASEAPPAPAVETAPTSAVTEE